jgi:hypothetical protein
MIDNKDKTQRKGSRNEMRMNNAANKEMDAGADTMNERGFSTEQRIDIENLKIRRKEREDRNKESTLVGLSIEAGKVSRLVQAAKKRVEQRCPNYDATNPYWIKVDNLLERETEVLSKIHTVNENHNSSPTGSDKCTKEFFEDKNEHSKLQENGNVSIHKSSSDDNDEDVEIVNPVLTQIGKRKRVSIEKSICS